MTIHTGYYVGSDIEGVLSLGANAVGLYVNTVNYQTVRTYFEQLGLNFQWSAVSPTTFQATGGLNERLALEDLHVIANPSQHMRRGTTPELVPEMPER